MTTPDDRRYSDEHEWALVDGNIVTVGVTQFATDSLGDVVYVDLPGGGAEVSLSLPEAPADQLVSPDQSQAS